MRKTKQEPPKKRNQSYYWHLWIITYPATPTEIEQSLQSFVNLKKLFPSRYKLTLFYPVIFSQIICFLHFSTYISSKVKNQTNLNEQTETKSNRRWGKKWQKIVLLEVNLIKNKSGKTDKKRADKCIEEWGFGEWKTKRQKYVEIYNCCI